MGQPCGGRARGLPTTGKVTLSHPLARAVLTSSPVEAACCDIGTRQLLGRHRTWRPHFAFSSQSPEAFPRGLLRGHDSFHPVLPGLWGSLRGAFSWFWRGALVTATVGMAWAPKWDLRLP